MTDRQDEQAHKKIRLDDDAIEYIDLGDDEGEPFPVQSRPPRRTRRTKDTNDVNKECHGGRSSKVIPTSGPRSTSGTPPTTKPKIGSTAGDGKKVSQIQKLQAAARMETNSKTNQKEVLLKRGKKIKGCSWVDRNLPANLDELFVHKKKVDEVMSWMKATMSNDRAVRSSKICVVTGPSGAGKTATVFLAAKELGLEIKEWVNAMSLTDYNPDQLGKFDPDDIICMHSLKSQFDIFTNFLFRAAQYSTIPIKGRTQSKHKLIIVEDFPNMFYKNSSQFHNNILRPFASMSVFPVIFIIADSSSRERNVNNLFPKSLIQELNIGYISFNSVATTLMVKFMTTICSKEGVDADKSMLEAIASASGGDLRCAVNTLQFKFTPANSRLESPKVFKVPVGKKTKNPPLKDVHKFSDVEKDNTLFIFRALGKILYSKRKTLGDIELDSDVPESAAKCLRPNQLEDDPQCVIEKMEVPADTFINFLQQNYIAFFGSMDDIVLASEFLADSEFLLSRWPFDDSGTASRTYKELQSREEIALLVASRGLMYSNVQKTKNHWRPLTKPMLTDARIRIQKSCEIAKQTFPHEGAIQMSFYSEVIPFYSKLIRKHSSIWMQDQREFIMQLGTINRQNRPRLQHSLSEKDATEDAHDDESQEVDELGEADEQNENEKIQIDQLRIRAEYEEDPEEYVIEDYSDEEN